MYLFIHYFTTFLILSTKRQFKGNYALLFLSQHKRDSDRLCHSLCGRNYFCRQIFLPLRFFDEKTFFHQPAKPGNPGQWVVTCPNLSTIWPMTHWPTDPIASSGSLYRIPPSDFTCMAVSCKKRLPKAIAITDTGHVTRSFIMVALCNRADHYIFALWFLSSIFYLLFLFLA